MLLAERQVLEKVARTLKPATGLGRATEVHAVDRELQSQACRSTVITEAARQPVATLVSLQRRRSVELRRGGHAKTQKRVRSLFLGERSLEVHSRLLPRALLQRCLPSLE